MPSTTTAPSLRIIGWEPTKGGTLRVFLERSDDDEFGIIVDASRLLTRPEMLARMTAEDAAALRRRVDSESALVAMQSKDGGAA